MLAHRHRRVSRQMARPFYDRNASQPCQRYLPMHSAGRTPGLQWLGVAAVDVMSKLGCH